FTAFDTETTGVDPETARIVTAAVLDIDPGTGSVVTQHWVIDPGVPIPDEAAQVHGYSTERVRAEGRKDVAAAIGEIADAVMSAVSAGLPLIVYNAPYDLTLLDRETRRHGLEPLGDRLRAACAVVVDPLVLDKHLDRYRKGRRTLTAVSEHYGVPIGEDAHGAPADALVTARVAWVMCQRYPTLAAMSLAELHDLQVKARAEQDASFAEYLRRQAETEVLPSKRGELQERAAA